MQRRWCWFLGLCLGLAAAGCGGPVNPPVTKDDMTAVALNDVAELYRMYTIEKKRPPTKPSDFNPLEMMSPTGVRAINDGEVVVRYGATLPDTGEAPGKGPGDVVLAYEKQVPESGGQVLMLNRTIRAMSPEEFKAAKLAGDGSSNPGMRGEKAK
jgi:hypothetical protein